MVEDGGVINVEAGLTLWKTTEYTCDGIKTYMDEDMLQCHTRNMIWLTEDRDRALSYGPEKYLKSFTLNRDIQLWNLMSDYLYPFKDVIMRSAAEEDPEIKGPMMTALNLFGVGGDSAKSKCVALYNFLTGAGMNVRGQLDILLSIQIELPKIAKTFNSIEFQRTEMTPDNRPFNEVIETYIECGRRLDEEQKTENHQRLSIYVLDQILLKLICYQEYVSKTSGVQGWYIPSGTNTVWTEIVGGQEVSDMGEIVLFNVHLSKGFPLSCGGVGGGGEKKKSKRKYKKRKRRRTRKKKKSKKRIRRKRSNGT